MSLNRGIDCSTAASGCQFDPVMAYRFGYRAKTPLAMVPKAPRHAIRRDAGIGYGPVWEQ
jgi:hypothetical protein